MITCFIDGGLEILIHFVKCQGVVVVVVVVVLCCCCVVLLLLLLLLFFCFFFLFFFRIKILVVGGFEILL